MDWFRSHHGAPTDPKWRVIGKRAGVRPGDVSAIVWALLDYASQQEDRGSIAGFDSETLAVTFDFEQQQIEAVIDALRDKNIIADDRFVQWEKRQPKREDSSTERVRALRKRTETQSNAPDTDTEREQIREEPNGSKHARARGEAPRQQTMSEEARAADAEFEDWYGGYPHKVGKGAARIAYRKARSKTDAGTLVLGRDFYVRSKPPDRDWCNPATWLNQERWTDQPDNSPKAGSNEARHANPSPTSSLFAGAALALARRAQRSGDCGTHIDPAEPLLDGERGARAPLPPNRRLA